MLACLHDTGQVAVTTARKPPTLSKRRMSNYAFLMPDKGLPATNFPANSQLNWYDVEPKNEAKDRKNEFIERENNLSYCFNSYGYRCPEFDTPADIRIVAIGCSYVMGTGLMPAELFHDKFGKQLEFFSKRSVVVWNLGVQAASNDCISRLLYLAVPYLDPHIVLINFTHGGRREYVSVQRKVISYNPGFRFSEKVGQEIYGHFNALTSVHDDVLNFFKNYKAMESLLKNRCWLFSTIDPQVLNQVRGHINQDYYVGNLDGFDKARDRLHPGPKSHDVLFENYWRKFLFLHGGINRRWSQLFT